MSDKTVTVSQVVLEVPIAAPRERVWKALVDETTSWWRKDFYAGKAKRFVIEAKLGGRMYEDWGDGAGLVWYTVIGLDPGRSLDLAGWLTPKFGGPASTMLRIELDGGGGKTLVKLSDAMVGQLSDSSARSKEEGWNALFAEGLKPYVEQSRPTKRAKSIA